MSSVSFFVRMSGRFGADPLQRNSAQLSGFAFLHYFVKFIKIFFPTSFPAASLCTPELNRIFKRCSLSTSHPNI
jgi:hypothetical protein